MNPACKLCGGACCTMVAITISPLAPADDKRWLSYHGPQTEIGVMLKSPCQHLTEGKCGIYETRPACCKMFEVGGRECREVLKVARPDAMAEILRLAALGD